MRYKSGYEALFSQRLVGSNQSFITIINANHYTIYSMIKTIYESIQHTAKEGKYKLTINLYDVDESVLDYIISILNFDLFNTNKSIISSRYTVLTIYIKELK